MSLAGAGWHLTTLFCGNREQLLSPGGPIEGLKMSPDRIPIKLPSSSFFARSVMLFTVIYKSPVVEFR